MKVKNLMRTHIATLHADDALDVAEDIMRMGQIRHLPVVDAKGWLVGILRFLTFISVSPCVCAMKTSPG